MGDTNHFAFELILPFGEGDIHLVTQIIDGDLGRLHVAAHADQDELRILAAIRLDKIVAPPGLLVE